MNNKFIVLPIRLWVRLSPLSRPFLSSNMNNSPPFPPQTTLHPLLYATQPVHPSHQPLTWIEKTPLSYVALFSMNINDVETLVILQNQNFLAQLISEGMKKAIEYIVNQIWHSNAMNSLVQSSTSQFIHTMRPLWNLQHLLNQFSNMNEIARTLFFTPQEIVKANPLFFLWNPILLQQGQFVNLDSLFPTQAPVPGELETAVVRRKSFTKISKTQLS